MPDATVTPVNKLTWVEYLARTDDADWLFDWCDDPERIYSNDIQDAAHEALDNAYPEIPDVVVIYAFQHAAKPNAEKWAADTLDNLLDLLDEEYGDTDGPTEPTPAMTEVMELAVRTVLAEYVVWTCERVAEIIVRREDLPDLWERQ